MVDLSKSLMYAAKIATSLNEGIYFDEKFDPAKQGLRQYEELDGFALFTDNGESAVLAQVAPSGESNNEAFCMLSFRGRHYDTDCGELNYAAFGKLGCFMQFRDKVEPDMRKIRDSAFTTSVEDDAGVYRCDNMNNELAANFHKFDMDKIEEKVEKCLDFCQLNHGSECPMYFTGHSQGGVYAQMAAMKFKHTIEDRQGVGPYLFTFGAPPAFKDAKMDSQCAQALPPSANIFNFVNIGSYDKEKPAIYDPAVSIGLEKNANHAETGLMVLMNDSDDLNIKASATCGGSGGPSGLGGECERYDDGDYDFYYNDEDIERLRLHDVSAYKSQIHRIVDATDGQPGQDGFNRGTCARTSQCNYKTLSCHKVRYEADEGCKKEWLSYFPPIYETVCKTHEYFIHGCQTDFEKCGSSPLLQRDYRGTIASTKSGRECQSWQSQSPHRHTVTEAKYLNAGVGNHNYCRNPDQTSGGAWCYTTDPGKRWEYCDVPKCTDFEKCGTSSALQMDYRGTIASTKTGRECQSWQSQSPHRHTVTEAKYPNAGLGNHNYCRNPDQEPGGAWCYTTDPGKRWEYCDVPKCQ